MEKAKKIERAKNKAALLTAMWFVVMVVGIGLAITLVLFFPIVALIALIAMIALFIVGGLLQEPLTNIYRYYERKYMNQIEQEHGETEV